MLCCYIPFPIFDRFIGCDGRMLSNELLSLQCAAAIEREDYEDAAAIRDELERRKKIHSGVTARDGQMLCLGDNVETVQGTKFYVTLYKDIFCLQAEEGLYELGEWMSANLFKTK